MRRAIIDAQIGFDFDDASGRFTVHQNLAQAVTRDLNRRPGVEIAAEHRGVSQQLRERERSIASCMLGG